MNELVRALRRAFEIGAHPLSLRGLDAPGPRRRIRFETAGGEPVEGWLLEPARLPAPAILYIHAHGGDYALGAEEVVAGRKHLAGPAGPALADAGFRVLCLDLPCFGLRSGVTESAAAKAAHWYGRTLAGQMLGELSSALDWLAADPDTDATRLGVFGLSMGATFAYWLSSVEPRVAAVAHLCCFADFGPLIDAWAHDRHNVYLTVPGLLHLATNGEIAAQIAPRPQFVGLGRADALTPPAAMEPALATLTAAYRDAGVEAALRVHIEPETGHVETPAMRAAMLTFFREALQPTR